MRELTFIVDGMTCEQCERSLVATLRSLSGVADASANFRDGKVRVTTTKLGSDDGPVAAAIERKGYRVVERHAGEPRSQALTTPATRRDNNTASGADVDLVVIGSGGAGVGAAIRAAERGASVVVVEHAALGGTCVNIGCIPSKTLIRAAAARRGAAHNPFDGVSTTAGAVDFAAVVSQKRALVTSLQKRKYADVLDSYSGIRVVRGRAQMRSDGVVQVDGTPFVARKVIIATGARPASPSSGMFSSVPFLTSTSAMELDAVPSRLVVVGAGYVALELAQTFARLGSKVTVIARSRPMRGEDEDIVDALTAVLRTEGLDVRTDTNLVDVRRAGKTMRATIESHGRTEVLACDDLLVAVGRTPNTEGLGLEAAGVAVDEGGHVRVDEHLQTTRPGVFAAGDVIAGPAFVYVAAYAGALAADNALSSEPRRYDVEIVPRVTFTDPAIASVGLTEAHARQRGLPVTVSTLPMAEVPRALAARDTRGLVKIVAHEESKQILGAHILAAEAGDIIEEAVIAMRFGIRVDELAKLFHPYLTNSEAIKLACQGFAKDIAKLSCCAS